jgi:hypothetical protein
MSKVSFWPDDPNALTGWKRTSQPYSDISPDEILSPLSAKRQKALHNKRDQYFLGGPISFTWIRNNIPDPTSRVVLVTQAFMDMSRSDEWPLTAKIWDCAGITNRDQRRRVLARLRTIRGNYEIEDRVGRPSVLRKVRVAAS